MSLGLFALAEKEGIMIHWWDFKPPLKAVYWSYPGLNPIIGLDNALEKNQAELRVVLAEELGHHFTSVGENIPRTMYHYSDRMKISKTEYLAMRWAALHLIPDNLLIGALESGIFEKWDLAEHFNVTEEFIVFRLNLPKSMR